jgi:hypothetical protein
MTESSIQPDPSFLIIPARIDYATWFDALQCEQQTDKGSTTASTSSYSPDNYIDCVNT